MPSLWNHEDIYLVAERAHSLYMQGSYREAAVLFEGLVVVAPDDSYCREALAAVYLAVGDPQAALAQLSELLARDPRNHSARARRCEAWWRLGRRDEARHDLDVLAGSNAAAHVGRLRILLDSAPALPPSGQL